MLYLLHGSDEVSRSEFLQALKAKMLALPAGEYNITVFDDPDLESVITTCDTVPFLCPKRMVIAHGLLARLLEPRRGGGGRRAPGEGKERPLDRFLAYVSRLPESTHLVLVEGNLDRSALPAALTGDARSPARRGSSRGESAVDGAPVVERVFPAPASRADLEAWIRQRARRRGVQLASEAARALADTAPDPRPGEDLGLHLRRLDNDLAKLAAYAGGASITPEDVRALVVGREATTFDLLDAVAEGRWRAAVTAYRRLLQQGETPESVVPQLAALVRRLLLVHETLREGRSLQAEARELGLSPSPRYLAKLSQQAQRFTDAALEQAYHALLACDVDVKTGRADPEVAVELVVHLLASDALPTEPDREMVVGGAYRGPW